MTRTIAIVVARLDSTRLPGKLLRFVNGKPLIQYVLERSHQIPRLANIVLATSDRAVDDPIADYGLKVGVDIFRGSVNDVALRLLECASVFSADHFIRVNGDSPFLDPTLVSQAMGCCWDHEVDLVTNLIGRTFPYGISVEMIRTDSMAKAYARMTSQEEKEHATQYFYRHLPDFRIRSITSPHAELKTARMVVDTEQDLDIFTKVVERLGDRIATVDYIEAAKVVLSLKGQLS